MANQQQSVVWIDVAGRTRQTIVLVNGTGSTIRSTLLGHSNADVLNWFEGPPNPNTSPSPSSSVYNSVGDSAQLIFADSSGNEAGLTLPAPQSGIFLADTVTVDASAIADVIAAATTYLVNSAGNTVTTYLAGFRRGSPSSF